MKAIKLALIGLLLLPALVLAEGKIAVLDMEAALASSKQAAALREKIQLEFSAEEAELRQLSDQGNAMKAKLEKEASFIGEDERKQMMADIQTKYQEFQSLGKRIKQEAQSREREFLQQLRPEVETILKRLVEEQKIDIIINKKGVVYAQPAADLTPRVVEELNKL
ncbi:MAG: OmpH family outer membrane protein [Motiliproteus sp.]